MRYGIKHQLYGFLCGAVMDFCFFEMGITHDKHTMPMEFTSEEANAFLSEHYPGDAAFEVVKL